MSTAASTSSACMSTTSRPPLRPPPDFIQGCREAALSLFERHDVYQLA
jgi:hypothetical protein